MSCRIEHQWTGLNLNYLFKVLFCKEVSSTQRKEKPLRVWEVNVFISLRLANKKQFHVIYEKCKLVMDKIKDKMSIRLKLILHSNYIRHENFRLQMTRY